MKTNSTIQSWRSAKVAAGKFYKWGLGKIFFDITIIFVLASALSAFCVCVFVQKVAHKLPHTRTHVAKPNMEGNLHKTTPSCARSLSLPLLEGNWVEPWGERHGNRQMIEFGGWQHCQESVPGRQTCGRQILVAGGGGGGKDASLPWTLPACLSIWLV